jgi:hypothetical protein
MAKKKVTRKRKPLHIAKTEWAQPTIKHIEKAAKEKHEVHDPFLSKIVFWTSIVIVIIANILTTVVLIPFLAVMQRSFSLAIITVIALAMGFLYNLLIVDINHLEQTHHVLAGIIVPLIAIVNVVVMVGTANQMIAALSIQNTPHNPVLTGTVYGVAFIVPYVIDRIRIAVNKGPLLHHR